MLTQKLLKEVLRIYGEAWTGQDPEKILTIFTPDAIYHERVLRQPHRGHKEIRAYWQAKVVEEQADIRFKVLHTYIDGNTAIAEWDAVFFNKVEKATIHIKEVAILEFKGEKIASLREYWQSERP